MTSKSESLDALYISLELVKCDKELQPNGRGARKVLVTDLYEKKEVHAKNIDWKPPTSDGDDMNPDSRKCPVHVTQNLEMAYFTESVPQDRHYHKAATEIYTLLEGIMVIEIEGEDKVLNAGDSIVVNPNTVHLVKSDPNQKFLCQVVSANCNGVGDKFVVS